MHVMQSMQHHMRITWESQSCFPVQTGNTMCCMHVQARAHEGMGVCILSVYAHVVDAYARVCVRVRANRVCICEREACTSACTVSSDVHAYSVVMAHHVCNSLASSCF